jgi:hypothetical protein
MPHKMFVLAYKNGPLGYLIRVPKALCILLDKKNRDSRLQLFFLKWVGALVAVVDAGIFGFNLLPMPWAVGVLTHCVFLFALILWLTSGDLFLKFVLEDEQFYNLATESHALSVFEDTEYSLPQPGN